MNQDSEEFRLGFILDADYTEKLLAICWEIGDEPMDLLKQSIDTMGRRLEAMRG